MPLKSAHPGTNSINAKISGFTLVELLLVIGISALMVTITIQIFNTFFEKQVNSMAGQHILKLQHAAEEYVAANFTAVLASVPNPGDTDEITPADLIVDGYLPAGYDSINAFKQASTTIIINAGPGVDGDTIEIISVSQDSGVSDRARDNNRIIDAAMASGPKVGVIIQTNIGVDCCNGNIQSFSGLWSVPITPAITGITSWTNDANRGYLAAYGRVSFSNTFNTEYLYRVEIAGQPELNRMETDLDMDNNTISGVGVISADNMAVGYSYNPQTNEWTNNGAGSGNVVIEGLSTGTGNFTPFGLTVDQALTARDVEIGFDVSGAGCVYTSPTITSGPGTCTITGGDFVMNGDNAPGNDLTITNTLTLAGDALPRQSLVSARDMTVTQLGAQKAFTAKLDDTNVSGTTTANNLTTFSMRANAGGTTFNIDSLQASGAAFGRELRTNNLVAGDVRNITTATVNGNVDVEGDVQSSGSITTNNMTASQTFLINNMTSCTNGC